jgi:predicted small lipoprotein YifL
MYRNVAHVLLGAAMLAAVAGCAYQDPLALPELDPPAQSRQPPYPGYSPYYGSGYNYSYGYGSGYRPGYDPYYSQYYNGGDPRYYAPGVVYVPYPQYVPVPCADVNQDGRCDQHKGVERPPRPGDDDAPGSGPRV